MGHDAHRSNQFTRLIEPMFASGLGVAPSEVAMQRGLFVLRREEHLLRREAPIITLRDLCERSGHLCFVADCFRVHVTPP